MDLETIFMKYNTDKNSSFHNYARYYKSLLEPYRKRPIKYLEIGVFEGESIACMKEVFPNSIIVGLDINPACKEYEKISENIFVRIGDASDSTFLRQINEEFGPFDVILDDGSHVNTDVIASFEYLFPLLSENGLYIVEDTVCFKSQHHLRPENKNHLDYFVSYIPALNQMRMVDSEKGIRDWCTDPYKILKKTSNVVEAMIDRMEFGSSYVAIHKKTRHHWL